MPKKGCLGCSFPVIIVVSVISIVLILLGLVTGPIGSSLLGNIGPSWLKVPTPAPELPSEDIFHIAGFSVRNTLVTAWISIVLIALLSYFGFRRMKLIPSGFQSVMEYIFGSLLNFCVGVAGERDGRQFFPVVATIFIFVIVNAWLSLLPFYGVSITIGGVPLLRAANTDLNVPLAIAFFSFVAVEFYGVKSLGFMKYAGKFLRLGQIKHGFGLLFKGKIFSALSAFFFGFIDVFVGALEGLSELIRIVSFTFRLFGNMMAGEILLLIAAYLIPFIVPVIFYGLEVLVGFIQALIFGGLTLVFLTLAVAAHGSEEPA
jgi:F-type H+-transporting ATPase subunit a